MLSSAMLKVAALIAAMLAERVAYTPPNARPHAEEMSAHGSGDALIHYAHVLSYSTLVSSWAVCACEIAALLARESRTPVASAVISFLSKGPSSVHRLAITSPFRVGLLTLICGAAVRKWCFRTLGRHFTFQLALRKEHKLVTSGPYAIIRHPAYTGLLLALAGTAATELAAGGWLRESGWLGTTLGRAAAALRVAGMVVTCVGLVRRVRKEDEVLRGEFGREWEEWAGRVPYALIPYVY
ncbi:ICMT-domain-containing protein [Trametes cingulata]|nr:ICMT-domain-containing protein [Trametes cingulata]